MANPLDKSTKIIERLCDNFINGSHASLEDLVSHFLWTYHRTNKNIHRTPVIVSFCEKAVKFSAPTSLGDAIIFKQSIRKALTLTPEKSSDILCMLSRQALAKNNLPWIQTLMQHFPKDMVSALVLEQTHLDLTIGQFSSHQELKIIQILARRLGQPIRGNNSVTAIARLMMTMLDTNPSMSSKIPPTALARMGANLNKIATKDEEAQEYIARIKVILLTQKVDRDIFVQEKRPAM